MRPGDPIEPDRDRKRKATQPGHVTVRFGSVQAFQPTGEVDFWVVAAFSDETGQWHYHPGPPKQIGFVNPEDALRLAKKVALAHEINPDMWWADYPRSTFEAADRKGMLKEAT